MRIAFQFDHARAMQAMAYFVARLGTVEKVKLMKLMYIADKQHFLEHGHPITGDRQCAMRWGPVPSSCLNTINGEGWPKTDAVFEFLHVVDNIVSLRQDPGTALLSTDEVMTLDDVIAAHAHKSCWKLVGETHRFPEYVEAYVDGTSTMISYEAMMKHSGRTDLFQSDRPVVGTAMLERMINPFWASETDL